MSIWYMVLNRDYGDIDGHDTWRYGSIPPPEMEIGKARPRGTRHAEVIVDALTEEQAMVIARSAFADFCPEFSFFEDDE